MGQRTQICMETLCHTAEKSGDQVTALNTRTTETNAAYGKKQKTKILWRFVMHEVLRQKENSLQMSL